MHWSVLTLAQLIVSSLMGALMLLVFTFSPYQVMRMRAPAGALLASLSDLSAEVQSITTVADFRAIATLSAVFTAGFVLLNMSLDKMHVSLVTSLR